MHTAVGTGLFDFGFRDGGRPTQALLQHPLGVTALPGRLGRGVRHLQRRRAPRSPTGRGDHAGHRAGRAQRRGRRRRPTSSSWSRPPTGSRGSRWGRRAAVDGFAHRTQRPVTEVAPGRVELVVDFTPPPGQKVDDRFGPPSQLLRLRDPARAAARRRGPRHRPARGSSTLDPAVGDGVLHVAARAASCDDGGRRGRRLPPAPAGLGRAGPRRRRRRRPSGAAALRSGGGR